MKVQAGLFAASLCIFVVISIASAKATDIWIAASNGSSHQAAFQLDGQYSCQAPPTQQGSYNCYFRPSCSGYVPVQGSCTPVPLSPSGVHTVSVNTDGRFISVTVQLKYQPGGHDDMFGDMGDAYFASCTLLWFTNGPSLSCQ